ncbi:MAG: hypothetical protein ACK466_03445 [Pseudanabaena sp.]
MTQDYLEIATAYVKKLAAEFATTSIERDKNGGLPKHERDRIRDSGLLKIAIPKA